MRKLSRQRIWQIEQHELGLCPICASPANAGYHCQKHTEYYREYYRNYYRRKRGIPLSAPISKQGRKVKYLGTRP